MSKITSKLQITLPKEIAVRFGLKPGDEISWEAGGGVVRIVPAPKPAATFAIVESRLKLFDDATKRQRKREAGLDPSLIGRAARKGRGWTRSDLYGRPGSR